MAKRTPDWGSIVARPADADSGTERREAEDVGGGSVASRPARPLRRVAKFPVTYRLPEDVLDLIDQAVNHAAEAGEKLSKEQAVADAIRQAYGS